jgi:endonuclease YncB( thermonuclease family)
LTFNLPMNKLVLKLLFVLILISCNDDTNGNQYPFENSMICNVTWVIDGDTFVIDYKSGSFKVRVLNIDCYETTKGERLKSQAEKAGISEDSALILGISAKLFATDLLYDKQVLLTRETDEPNTDVYSRLLRNVEIEGVKYDTLLRGRGLLVPD